MEPPTAKPTGLVFLSTIFFIALLSKPTGAVEPIDYVRQVKPILKERCYACHGALKQKAGLRLDTGKSIREGGDGGPGIEPGRPDESLLVDRLTEKDPSLRMPPEGMPLTPEQLKIVRGWIDQNAVSPIDESPEADPRKHWSFVPPIRPALPNVANRFSVRSPIDRFIAWEYERRGVTPVGEAEPHVLIRRLYLDLTGLPPSREQLREYVADPSDASYRRIVDRLLASPQYGERWARHWMDVWRYSDWYGRRAVPDVLNSYAQIWRWRDWIVKSINDDKGYDRMVREMLAADELQPTKSEDLAATGFVVRNFYRWNYNLWMKDNVEHTGKAFLGLTFNCAHCHDHKYDPIKHEDYFALRAVFEPVEIRHDRVPGEPDPGPYPKYDYGAAYKPITSGRVRVFDANLDAKTFLYTRGESRNIVPGRPPIEPGMPKFLGGDSFRVEPVELPAEAAYPGIQDFVKRDEIDLREQALASARAMAAKARDLANVTSRALAEAEAKWNPGVPRAFDDPLIGVHAFASETPAPADFLKARTEAELARLTLRVDESALSAAQAELAAIHGRIAADEARITKASDADTKARRASRLEREASVAKTAVDSARAERAAAPVVAKPAEAKKAAAALDAAIKAHAAALAAISKDSPIYSHLSPTYPSKSTGRRAALARWITDRRNPLSARVAVNHLWRWHFGSPLVASTFDFGRNGALPTHPELLDWLAVEFMEPSGNEARPWSMKAIHRLILTSSAYRMRSSTRGANSATRAIDPTNRWYWHFPITRMEAEDVRDGLLFVAGSLDTSQGGPDIDFGQGLTSHRRSLYFTHHGEARMPFLEIFDAPDACDAYKRSSSVVPQQALALVNNEMVLDLSRGLSERLWAEAERTGAGDDAFIIAAFEQVLSRRPSATERELSCRFLAKQAEIIAKAKPSDSPKNGSLTDPEARARRDFVHALFSHNDFVTIH